MHKINIQRISVKSDEFIKINNQMIELPEDSIELSFEDKVSVNMSDNFVYFSYEVEETIDAINGTTKSLTTQGQLESTEEMVFDNYELVISSTKVLDDDSLDSDICQAITYKFDERYKLNLTRNNAFASNPKLVDNTAEITAPLNVMVKKHDMCTELKFGPVANGKKVELFLKLIFDNNDYYYSLNNEDNMHIDNKAVYHIYIKNSIFEAAKKFNLEFVKVKEQGQILRYALGATKVKHHRESVVEIENKTLIDKIRSTKTVTYETIIQETVEFEKVRIFPVGFEQAYNNYTVVNNSDLDKSVIFYTHDNSINEVIVKRGEVKNINGISKYQYSHYSYSDGLEIKEFATKHDASK